jgi:hypothetical protein
MCLYRQEKASSVAIQGMRLITGLLPYLQYLLPYL